MRALLSCVALAATAGCSSSSASSAAGDSGTADAPVLGDYDPVPFGGARPTKLYVPSHYSPAKPAPLVVMLHGYSASGLAEDLYLDLRPVAEANDVLYIHPDGTVDAKGNRFWNATDACCNLYGAQVDDVGYLMSLIAEVRTRYSVDPRRIYFFGHSNGAFMSYRMACDHAETVAAIASLAGAMWTDTGKCKPSQPVPVLEIHGTADQVIYYDGGTTSTDTIFDGGTISGGGPYPGVLTTIADWVSFDGCSTPGNTSLPNLDLESSLPGAETKVTQYKSGCRNDSEVDLWSVQGASHIPNFTPDFAPDVFAFLLAHPKP